MRRVLFSLVILSIAFPIGAWAGTISFDEFPASNNNRAVLSTQYADMGVHFVATDDGAVWSGLSAGDPGGWGLEGTNGGNFLGFNGRSYAVSMLLDESVAGFKLDVARSMGSDGSASFTLAGFRAGIQVEEVFVDLGANAVNEWATASLSQDVDEVQMLGGGSQPFGVDNVRWGGEPVGAMAIRIDVKPGNSDVLNPFSRGVVPVVIFGSEDFDVEDVDAGSIAFGPNGAPVFADMTPKVSDVDGDGYLDLFCHHAVPDSGIAMGDTEVCLTGNRMSDGRAFEGCTAVTTTPSSSLSSSKVKVNGKAHGHHGEGHGHP
ncbi:MAG: hypothetical protein OEM49_03175 [Myxococcales bacterium]|nr:hypothetical protein [Myxococcales bacterium]